MSFTSSEDVCRCRLVTSLAAALENVSYDATSGALSFRIQNQTGHKLISGFPEGRRMFINIRAYQGGALIYEVNPYDQAAGTLKGLGYTYDGRDDIDPPTPLTSATEIHIDQLVYESKPSTTLLNDAGAVEKTFHFALANGRYKDNRIPPKGFRIAEAGARLSTPAWNGAESPGYFNAAEYAGGYDDVSVTIAAGADYVEVGLYYQTTSREYVEFLRDEINGTATTLPGTGAGGDPPYIVQSDPFFNQLKAWGDTIWQLWLHNREVTTAAPFLMVSAAVGEAGSEPAPVCDTPGTPQGLTAVTRKGKKIELIWSAGDPAPATGGYNIYYDQAGKLSHVASVPAGTTRYLDTGLNRNVTYCYLVTAFEDCNRDGSFTPGRDVESGSSQLACAPAN